MESLDWVGRTEKLSSETIPLVTSMLDGTKHSFDEHEKTNISEKGILNKLDEVTVTIVKSRMELDSKLYDGIKDEFLFHKHYGGLFRES